VPVVLTPLNEVGEEMSNGRDYLLLKSRDPTSAGIAAIAFQLPDEKARLNVFIHITA